MLLGSERGRGILCADRPRREAAHKRKLDKAKDAKKKKSNKAAKDMKKESDKVKKWGKAKLSEF